ncbi:MAG TPA: hypothetical protein VFS33_01930 [Gemmatimonadales bacterium]|nr:hypothetical protein [Gemmatimonadales bacterium]
MVKRALAATALLAAIACGRSDQRDVGLERTARRDVRPPDDTATTAPSPVPPAAAESAASAAPARTPKRGQKSQSPAASKAADTAPLPAGTPSASEVAGVVAKLGLTISPAQGQTRDQQARDERRCYAWAHSQTGIDPMAVAANLDSAGAVAGGKARTEAEQQAAQPAGKQAQAHVAQMTGAFKKAMSACLKGKGYTTK